jgi:predicted metal-binding protein
MAKARKSVSHKHVVSRRGRTKPAGMARLLEAAVKLGARDPKVIRPADVVTGNWVRWKCQFGCGGFLSSLACPPHSPTPAETRRVLDEYSRAIFFEAPDGDSKKIAVALEREVFLAGYYKAFGLGSGPCPLCKKCAFDKGCRHPDTSRPSMEACGIDVFATVRKHGYTINVVRDYNDPQHYFGMVLVE